MDKAQSCLCRLGNNEPADATDAQSKPDGAVQQLDDAEAALWLEDEWLNNLQRNFRR